MIIKHLHKTHLQRLRDLRALLADGRLGVLYMTDDEGKLSLRYKVAPDPREHTILASEDRQLFQVMCLEARMVLKGAA